MGRPAHHITVAMLADLSPTYFSGIRIDIPHFATISFSVMIPSFQ
jgi:hypothetical protein